MISMTTDKSKMVGADGAAVSYVGLSSDTKPSNPKNGSTFLEMDTSDVYIYDAENEEWVLL